MTSSSAAVRGQEYGARKGDVSLFMWRKRVPGALDPARPPVLLVHGSSMSSQPTFDLEVPGHPDYSFMDWLARLGHDVWTLDHEGYGRSTITASNSDIACGVEDLKAAVPVIQRETGATALQHLRPVVRRAAGGGIRRGRARVRRPPRARRVRLDRRRLADARQAPRGHRLLQGQQPPPDRPRLHREHLHPRSPRHQRTGGNGRVRGGAARFCRLRPDWHLPRHDHPAAAGRSQPASRLQPWSCAASTTASPPKRTSPPSSCRLPNEDKQFSVLPGLAHCTPLGTERHRLWSAVKTFFDAASSPG